MEFKWIEGFAIKVKATNNEVVISANTEGLISLSNMLAELAKNTITGEHVHLDQYNSLEEDSDDLIIEKCTLS